MKYTYIFAPKNAQNIIQFDLFLSAYPELVTEKRERKDIWSRNKNDIITPNPDPSEPPNIQHFGELFLMIKAETEFFKPEMLDDVFEPQTFMDTNEIRLKFWV